MMTAAIKYIHVQRTGYLAVGARNRVDLAYSRNKWHPFRLSADDGPQISFVKTNCLWTNLFGPNVQDHDYALNHRWAMGMFVALPPCIASTEVYIMA